jgi:hypothetical protein
MITLLVSVAIGALVVSLLLSPIETLGWWAGWYGHGLEDPRQIGQKAPTQVGQPAHHYVLYLDGIANVGGFQYRDVQGLLDGLTADLPNTRVIGNIMPYSVRDVALLSEQRPLANWWRRMFERKLEERRSPLSFSINLRNLFQVLVAADPRYGRIFGRGEAQVMLAALLNAGYVPGSGTPITIIGYSGGVQVGLAATPFLKRALKAPVAMISLAGVMASEAGLDWLDIMYHLQSPTDRVPLWGTLLFPGRWPFMKRSHWNRMLKSHRLRFVNMGPMSHNGPGSYLDDATLRYGESNLTRTRRVMVDLIGEILEHHEQAATPLHPAD